MEKSKGRPKGSKNKATAEIRERFKELVESNLSKMQDDLDTLEPQDRLSVIMQMARFVLPTLKTVDIEHTLGGDGINQPQININYNDKPISLNTDKAKAEEKVNNKLYDPKFEAFKKDRTNWRQ